jgi:4,5:9,10-diseco-3-hydroxy-5,9,17-trioxoandrosta-1(10),2-diene-4-oate hydrolase
MNHHSKQLAGTAVASVLAVDALLHIYWLTGARWPAHDTATLSQAVLGIDASFDPPVLAPLIIVLLTGSAVTLAQVGRLGTLGDRVPSRWRRAGVTVVAGGLLARALGGVVVAAVGHENVLFSRLNLLLYTPLCFALAGAAGATIRRPPSATPERPANTNVLAATR